MASDPRWVSKYWSPPAHGPRREAGAELDIVGAWGAPNSPDLPFATPRSFVWEPYLRTSTSRCSIFNNVGHSVVGFRH